MLSISKLLYTSLLALSELNCIWPGASWLGHIRQQQQQQRLFLLLLLLLMWLDGVVGNMTTDTWQQQQQYSCLNSSKNESNSREKEPEREKKAYFRAWEWMNGRTPFTVICGQTTWRGCIARSKHTNTMERRRTGSRHAGVHYMPKAWLNETYLD